jgi:hypothetical protein
MLGIVCSIKLMKETTTMASIPTQEEVLAATRKSQEAMMAAIKTWLETVRTATPKLTSVYAPLTDKLPKLPASLPFADKLPTPQDAVANAYHLAEQLLASQRKFAEELLKATAPLMPGRGESTAEVPSRGAWQEAVTDSEPKTLAPARPAAVASTPPKAAPARPTAKSTPATSARKTTTATSARKSAGAKTAAPKGTDAS